VRLVLLRCEPSVGVVICSVGGVRSTVKEVIDVATFG
jgi:hypothetical protein